MIRKGVFWQRADNKRVSQKGALGGWDQMRSRIKGVMASIRAADNGEWSIADGLLPHY